MHSCIHSCDKRREANIDECFCRGGYIYDAHMKHICMYVHVFAPLPTSTRWSAWGQGPHPKQRHNHRRTRWRGGGNAWQTTWGNREKVVFVFLFRCKCEREGESIYRWKVSYKEEKTWLFFKLHCGCEWGGDTLCKHIKDTSIFHTLDHGSNLLSKSFKLLLLFNTLSHTHLHRHL